MNRAVCADWSISNPRPMKIRPIRRRSSKVFELHRFIVPGHRACLIRIVSTSPDIEARRTPLSNIPCESMHRRRTGGARKCARGRSVFGTRICEIEFRDFLPLLPRSPCEFTLDGTLIILPAYRDAYVTSILRGRWSLRQCNYNVIIA